MRNREDRRYSSREFNAHSVEKRKLRRSDAHAFFKIVVPRGKLLKKKEKEQQKLGREEKTIR